MTERLKGWVTPGTLTTAASLLFSVGSFVGIANYSRQQLERQVDDLKGTFTKQVEGLEVRSNRRMDQLEGRFAGADADGKQVAAFQAEFRQNQLELAGLKDDIKYVRIFADSLGRELAAVKAVQGARDRQPQSRDQQFTDMHQDRKDKP